MRSFLASLISLCSLCLCGELVGDPAAPQETEPHRSPIAVALVPGGTLALTANHTADTVSLVDLRAGKVLSEPRTGSKPVAVACCRDGQRAAVSNLWSGTVTFLELHGLEVQVIGQVAVGAFPRGLVFAPAGKALYVAVAGADEVVQLDWDRRQVVDRWPAPREPRELALSADGRWLAAASSRSSQVRC
jgi:DNA-binding beta-propeller fold protein YncE